MQQLDYLKSTNAAYIDELFEQYLEDPLSVDESWRFFFEGLELGSKLIPVENGHAELPHIDVSAEAKVAELINAYRENGRLIADIDPLNPPASAHPLLDLSRFSLTDADLDRVFTAGKLIGLGPAKLSDIIAVLRDTYCRTIGVEFTHIQIPEAREWLQMRMEASHNRDPDLDVETKKKILRRLTKAETFERFLHTRYVAQKRFSIEGGESLIPALDCMIHVGAENGAEEFVLGMAHRGRLNVLTHLFGKKPEQIFTEFEGTYKMDPSAGEGDVKYHKGYSADFTARSGKKVHLSLSSNPSHLEFINPVVEGSVRARQDRKNDSERAKVIPVLIHGDAAFAGQGICYETLNLSQLDGYKTGGTFHVVLNNQIGFTAEPSETRSTNYSTDLAKTLDGAPIFHVNGDDPEAVWYAAKLCIEYRQTFHRDVFIDLICYRKHGHNESDEPAFTQPLMYKKIRSHTSPREIYAQQLVREGVITEEESNSEVEEIITLLTESQQRTRSESPQPYTSVFEGAWKGLRQASSDSDYFGQVKTSVDSRTLREIAKKLNQVPQGFNIHPKLARLFEGRLRAVEEGQGIDWGNGEALAFATLLTEGHAVRLSGQDAERGTFSHRHSVWHDVVTGDEYTALNHLSEKQAHFSVYNSHLSEAGVLGFEHGYTLAEPNALVVWEAQFGDFANGAQVIIDQFIASSESKWQRMSGLTLLLPHGYEGQGPEHSSARLERFLSLCGKNNMSVCNLTTPAQLFHALRRQLKREFRKPLVIMSPKSLLRLPQAISSLDDFTSQGFMDVLDDPVMNTSNAAKQVKRVLLCTGKVYYDLVAERTSRNRSDVAIIRLEQLYPWPQQALMDVMKRYAGAKDLVWVQEEPRNMGAWSFVFNTWSGGFANFRDCVDGRPIRYIGREIGAAPAVGSHKLSEIEQKTLIEKAFEETK